MATLDELHRVVVHIVARSRFAATGRFSLRVTPGGVGTPDFGDEARRVRVAGSTLIVESDLAGAPSVRAMPIGSSSLRSLAEFAGVDLEQTLDVGHDTPPTGEVDAPIVVDETAVAAAGAWYGVAQRMLDLTVAALGPDAAPTLPRVWPEHLDVAFDAATATGARVNLGASPGDGFCPEPYIYVGPWTSDRPGEQAYWNAPFGAFRQAKALGDDPVGAGFAFLLEGLRRFT
jgi:hypothetical protein